LLANDFKQPHPRIHIAEFTSPNQTLVREYLKIDKHLKGCAFEAQAYRYRFALLIDAITQKDVLARATPTVTIATVSPSR
jgi:hypothetical protein